MRDAANGAAFLAAVRELGPEVREDHRARVHRGMPGEVEVAALVVAVLWAFHLVGTEGRRAALPAPGPTGRLAVCSASISMTC